MGIVATVVGGVERVAQPVRDPGPGLDPLQVRDPRPQAHRRAQLAAEMVDAVPWRDPVDRDPGSNERVPRRVDGPTHRPSSRRGPTGVAGSVGEHGLERRELIGGRRVSDVVGARQMGRHAGQPEPRPCRTTISASVERVRRGDTDAAHAGVDLEMHVEPVEPVDVERGQGLDVGTWCRPSGSGDARRSAPRRRAVAH